jgi:hypothetical protein
MERVEGVELLLRWIYLAKLGMLRSTCCPVVASWNFPDIHSCFLKTARYVVY